MGATAETLTDRLDALADALRAAGVDADRMASILGTAATATMNALVLGAVLDENAELDAAAAAPAEPATVPVDEPLRVAA